MATILLLETATDICSVALSHNGNIIAMRESADGFRHSEMLTVFADEIFRETGIKPGQLDAVCTSRGPGSYTGLRIGVSAAKGFCYALNIPLIAISTLHTQAYFVAHNAADYGITLNSGTLLCPMLDARRMEVYTALFDWKGQPLTEISAQIIDEQSFANELQNHSMVFFGNGADKCKPLLNRPDAVLISQFQASARFMSALAEDKFNKKQVENVAYFEPYYLKDFVATVPKNKVF